MRVDVNYAIDHDLIPCMVFDANGVEIKGNIVEFDDDTGRVVRHMKDERGQLIIQDDEVLRGVSYYPAPLIYLRRP